METAGLVVRVRIEDLPEEETWPKHEIIDGTLIVTPFAGVPHQGLVARITHALMAACPDGLVVYPGVNVRHVHDGEADLLIPDVALARAGTSDPTYVTPADVLLAIEVVSPSSRTMDTVTKPATYAAWGVPAYLAVTPLPGGRAALTWHGDVSAVAWVVEALEAALG